MKNLGLKIFIAQFPLILSLVWGFVLLGTVNQKVMTQIDFCEQPSLQSTLNQPINSWSTLSFVLVGMLISTHAAFRFRESPVRMFQQAVIPIAYSSAVAMIGYGSLAFHGIGTLWGGQWDGVSTLIFFSLVLSLSTTTLVNKTNSQCITVTVWFMFVLTIVMLAFVLPEGFMIVSVACPILNALINIIILCFPRFRGCRPRRPMWFWVSQALLLFALMIWALSRNKDSPLCDPKSWFQGHAVWHAFCSMTCLSLYAYHCTEKPISSVTSEQEEEENHPQTTVTPDVLSPDQKHPSSSNNSMYVERAIV